MQEMGGTMYNVISTCRMKFGDETLLLLNHKFDHRTRRQSSVHQD